MFSEKIKYLKLYIERLHCILDSIDPEQKNSLERFQQNY